MFYSFLIGIFIAQVSYLLSVESAASHSHSASSEQQDGQKGPRGPRNHTLPADCNADDLAKLKAAHQGRSTPGPGQTPPPPGQALENLGVSDACQAAIVAEMASHNSSKPGHGPHGKGPRDKGPKGQGPPGKGSQGQAPQDQASPVEDDGEDQGSSVAKRSPADEQGQGPKKGGAPPQLPEDCTAEDQAKLKKFRESNPAGHGPRGTTPPGQTPPPQDQTPQNNNPVGVSEACSEALVALRSKNQN